MKDCFNVPKLSRVVFCPHYFTMSCVYKSLAGAAFSFPYDEETPLTCIFKLQRDSWVALVPLSSRQFLFLKVSTWRALLWVIITSSLKIIFCLASAQVSFFDSHLFGHDSTCGYHSYIGALIEMCISITFAPKCTLAHINVCLCECVIILSCTEEEMSLSDLGLVRWLIPISTHIDCPLCVSVIFLAINTVLLHCLHCKSFISRSLCKLCLRTLCVCAMCLMIIIWCVGEAGRSVGPLAFNKDKHCLLLHNICPLLCSCMCVQFFKVTVVMLGLIDDLKSVHAGLLMLDVCVVVLLLGYSGIAYYIVLSRNRTICFQLKMHSLR